jgi:large subunit ribosomal protein L6
MRKDLIKKIKIPEGTEIKVDGNIVEVEGKEGKSTREFKIKKIKLEKKDDEIILSSKQATKKEKKIMNSVAAHIKNMIKGTENKFVYKLKICYSHFPMTIETKENEITIKNFLGEKIPRKSKVIEGVKVDVDRDVVEISSKDREAAGQTAANLEKATWIRMRDRRIFQDGIFITSKPGRDE